MLTEKDNNVPLAIYKNNKSYQEITRRNYKIKDPRVFYDDTILLLIYAYEWFKIPERNAFEKVCFHPYLTKGDFNKANELRENQKINLFAFCIVPLYAGLFLIKRKIARTTYYRRNWSPIIGIVSAAILVPFACWNVVLKKKLDNDIKEDPNLKKYLTLDLDKNKISKDLLNYNITI
jgi:hypothetical protein